jgi:S1-C subfamily serine protease
MSEHKRHIKHLRRHRNVLYGVVVVLLIFQISSFVFMSGQFSKITAQQGVIREDIDKYVLDLESEIGEVRQESQFSINEITQEMARQGKDIQSQIAFLKANSQEDFSGVIEEVVEKVVNIRTDRSGGTGFIVNSNGYVVTNFHVIQDGLFVQVQTFDGTVYDAELIAFDALADLALLQIPASLDSLELANSDNVQVGEKVIAIGNPLGLSFTVTEGIVSAVDRAGPNGLENYIQSDVSLNPGNSGGPLINKEGKVIGLNNFKIGGAEALGFALESNIVKERINIIANATIIE